MFFIRSLRHKVKIKQNKKRYYGVDSSKNSFFMNSVKENRRIKATFRCPIEYKALFHDSNAQITISLGSDDHEDQKLSAPVCLAS